ncbi:Cysteinyl-tRNA synthetase [Staphylococcus aureus]|nr:Cysteinyl-tRNA synthetase [Staphylococcus aureus]
MSKKYVSAKSQAQTLEYLMEKEWFTDEEMDILKRGRNAKSHTKSKNADELLDEDVEKLIEERNEARKNKDFARADEIRDMLKSQNIILEDTPQGVRFKRG